jgi:hypothetical protein
MPSPTSIAMEDEWADREPCCHDSLRRQDGMFDNTCIKCGADGYWHIGHRHDVVHPSGKILFHLACPWNRE